MTEKQYQRYTLAGLSILIKTVDLGSCRLQLSVVPLEFQILLSMVNLPQVSLYRK